MTGDMALTIVATFAVVNLLMLGRAGLVAAPWSRVAAHARRPSRPVAVPALRTRPVPGPELVRRDRERRPSEVEVLSAALGPADAARCRRPGCDHKRDHRRAARPESGTAGSRAE